MGNGRDVDAISPLQFNPFGLPGTGMYVRAVPWGAHGWGIDARSKQAEGARGEVWRRRRGGWSDFFCMSLVGRESRIAADGIRVRKPFIYHEKQGATFYIP